MEVKSDAYRKYDHKAAGNAYDNDGKGLLEHHPHIPKPLHYRHNTCDEHLIGCASNWSIHTFYIYDYLFE